MLLKVKYIFSILKQGKKIIFLSIYIKKKTNCSDNYDVSHLII